MSNRSQLLEAVALAQAGDWDAAHNIAQDYSDNTANWIHAVLHKMEGDRWNSKYWYAKTGGHQYEEFGSDISAELAAIQQTLAAD
jgi:predicted ATP-dependent serine protease